MNSQSLTAPGADPVQYALAKPDSLSQRQENFARHYVEHGSAIEAYRHAYNVAPTTNRNSLRSTAYNVLHSAKVAARVAALQAAASHRTLTTTADLIADLEAMALADVNEIMTLTVGACRHCWGEAGAYHFRDELEHAQAMDVALAAGEPLPRCGGYGYRSDREPNADCPSCDGVGLQRVRLNNTADVSLGARRLFKGVELYQDGSVKRVLLNDPLAARMELHRVRGMHVDRSVSVSVSANVPALKDMTTEQALAFLETLKPTTPTATPAAREPITLDAEP